MIYSPLTLDPVDLVEQESSATSYRDLITTVISSLKDDQIYENHDQGDTWKFAYGTVQVLVHLSGETSSDTLSIWSPVLTLPVKQEAQLFRALLSKNWSDTLEARFCLWRDQVVLNHCRTLEGLNVNELSRAITVVATLADEYDELLQQEFNT